MDDELFWNHNIMNKQLAYIIFAVVFLFSSCKKEENNDIINPVGQLGTIQLAFDNVVGEQELILDSVVYQSIFNQDFTVKKFNYFISNIELKTKAGNYISLEQDSSYFLIKEAISSTHLVSLNRLALDEYTGIRFIIGVDSLRNTMPIEQRQGVLDVGGFASDMYWTWNQGYIFLKLECHKPIPKGSPDPAKVYVYHIGGFGGMNDQPTVNNLKTVTLDFPNSVQLTASNKPKISIKADLMNVISGIYDVDIDKYSTVMLTPFSTKIAENYSYMFSITKAENN